MRDSLASDFLADEDLGETRDAPRPIAPGRLPATARLGTVVILRKEDGSIVRAGAEAAVSRAASSSGAPLPDDVRARFESSLGADLSRVRVHTGTDSASAAGAVGAHAYTVGDDIHFAAGRYAPADPFGLHLLAHEVAHTVQQDRGIVARQIQREPDPAAGAGVATDLPAALDPSTLVFHDGPDFQAVRGDLDRTAPIVQTFIRQHDVPDRLATINGIALDDPQAALSRLKPSSDATPAAGTPQPPSDAVRDLNVVSVARGSVHQCFHLMRGAQERLVAGLRAKQDVARMPDGAPPGASSDAAQQVEHVWDAIAQVVSVQLDATVGQLLLAIAGTDAVKDRVTSLVDHVVGLQEQVDDDTGRIDGIIGRLGIAASAEVEQARRDLAGFRGDYHDAMTIFVKCLSTYVADVSRAIDARAAEQPTPASGEGAATGKRPPSEALSAVYAAVLADSEAYRNAKSALLGTQLDDGRYQRWAGVLAPLGSVVFANPGSMVIYERNGAHNVFRTSEGVVQELSAQMEHVLHVHAFGPTVERRAAAWTAAMTSGLGLG